MSIYDFIFPLQTLEGYVCISLALFGLAGALFLATKWGDQEFWK
jgi:hypothetical protein